MTSQICLLRFSCAFPLSAKDVGKTRHTLYDRYQTHNRSDKMSDTEETPQMEVEETKTETAAPKGKMSVEDALQVCSLSCVYM